MATKPSSFCFLNRTLAGFSYGGHFRNVRFSSPQHHQLLLPALRQRHFSFRCHLKKRKLKKASTERRPLAEESHEAAWPSTDHNNIVPNLDAAASINEEDANRKDPQSRIEPEECVDGRELESLVEVEHIHDDDSEPRENPTESEEAESLALNLNVDDEKRLSSVQLEDLIGMLRNAEKNVHVLNDSRIRALEDLDKILSEKESLQGEINFLETRLAETDAKLKVAAQEKINGQFLENQLEQLRNELTNRSPTIGDMLNHLENPKNPGNKEVSLLQNYDLTSLSEELNSLRTENMFLKQDLEVLKAQLSATKKADKRVITLENERSTIKSSLKDLEYKVSTSQADVSKLSSLKVEYRDLWDRVEGLQSLLDKATKQADQAIIVLQQNQELRKKVDKLEESLEEANIYKLSSGKLQDNNELMQQKIKLLEEHLQRSDNEIHSYVQLYHESIHEFQDTLNNLIEESKKRALDEPVDDMPWDFWSRLLLKIDGWVLEKKFSTDDARFLRDLVWKRDKKICDAYMQCEEKDEHDSISTFRKLASQPGSLGLHVIHIAAEMAPVAKVGGLGDVISGLCKALQKRGHLVEIILPKYDCMQYDQIYDLKALDLVVESYFDGKLYKNKIWTGVVEGLPAYFIEPLHPGKFFWRGQFYGEHDDFKRFSFFSRAALELLLQSGKKPDIIHCHEWQTAFIAPLYWEIYSSTGLNTARICFTCHNFEHQGIAPASDLVSCGLDVKHLNRPDRMQDHSAHDRVNPVKGAVVYSNIVTTVSPSYAREVLTTEGGKGLQSTLNTHSKKFVGILNGIDSNVWNPSADGFLSTQYSANALEGKAANKTAIRRDLGLSTANDRQPLVGCITRLVPQKGVHLIRHAIYRTLELGGQFVLLGSSPVTQIQQEFEGIAKKFRNNGNVRLILKYDEALSHSIYAASDMFIIPSIFEPCGLTQMIAMRYGSVPIVRKTGGLNDSVFDVDDDTIAVQFRNGYTFLNPDEEGFNSPLERAFKHYSNDMEGWEELVRRIMKMDFSWESSVTQYEILYSKAVARARARA
ncbi:Probable starch synthase 4, chloroplastic/amyloplastic [Linum perenne]